MCIRDRYTGVTSATGDNSIVGFVLVNQRTAESHFYSVAGATEDSAMQSAEGQVQNLRYQATFPILINVSNTPTYFMALKDDAGLVKKYAMVDIRSYQNVAVGDTVADTQKSYICLLYTSMYDRVVACQKQSRLSANSLHKRLLETEKSSKASFPVWKVLLAACDRILPQRFLAWPLLILHRLFLMPMFSSTPLIGPRRKRVGNVSMC